MKMRPQPIQQQILTSLFTAVLGSTLPEAEVQRKNAGVRYIVERQ